MENCWEYKKCGKQMNCPAYTERKTNNVNRGFNGGRACWVVTGTHCGGIIQGNFTEKMLNCMNCDFYKQVRLEEIKNGSYSKTNEILQMLK